MIRKTGSLILAVIFFVTNVFAQEEDARWLRRSSISPDGTQIAFSYQGDIFTVSAEGGVARQITSTTSYESYPLWTPDGKKIVFSSMRNSSRDVFIVDARGGAPLRLTNYSGAETPMAVTPEGEILFSANIQLDPSYKDYLMKEQLYAVGQEGGKPRQVTSLPISNISVSPDGTILYEDYKGVEDNLRKHHTSSVTRDVWLYEGADPKSVSISGSGKFTKVSTSYEGENRNPVFAPDGHTYYYVSEEKGNFNIFQSDIRTPGVSKQISFLPTHPVRYISISANGKLAFSYNGDLYTMVPGNEPKKVDIKVIKDLVVQDSVRKSVSISATELAISPNGNEVAIVSRGDVYVTSIDQKTTRRITKSFGQERYISFSGDGRELYYDSERDGYWGIYKTSLKNKKDKYFTFSFDFEEEAVTPAGQTCMQPAVSPDGKYLAYLKDRTDIMVMDLSSGKSRCMLSGANYSYQDGDQSFSWSPDSHYILTGYQANGGWNNEDVAVIDIDSGQVTNLTESGYSDSNFKWALKGKAMTWESDKAGYRSHGSWGAEGDIYLMFFDRKEFYEFNKSKEDREIEKILKEGTKEEKKEIKDSIKEEKKNEKIILDLIDRDERIVKLTKYSGRLGDHFLSPDGTKLYYAVRLEKSTDLCMLDITSGSIKVVEKGFSGSFYPDKDGKYIYILGSLGIDRMDVATGSTKSISFSDEYDYFPSKERAYIFEHCWKEVKEKFYDSTIHGIDWDGFKDNYAQFLPYIDNNYDFQELLSEFLGELNASHTGARYSPNALLGSGHIGVLYDDNYTGEGLRIAEVLPGGPINIIDPEVKAGDIIVAINGEKIPAGSTWYSLLLRKYNKRTLFTIKKGNKTEDIYITPTTSDSDLLYKRWIKRNERLVEELSGGRVGYVHVSSMDSDSFRNLYSKALGKYRTCDALIVDTRHNGGGWLHDDLATFLSGEAYINFEPRGQYIGTEPYNKWNKPSCVITGEDNYSDASGFPYVYKQLGIGKLIGAPVPGTMTAVWWETQIDATMVFGIPEVTSISLKDGSVLENQQIVPDILVYNDPASILNGRDLQIEAAVAEMLREIDKK